MRFLFVSRKKPKLKRCETALKHAHTPILTHTHNMLIGVAGPKNSGKDTFAERFKLEVPTAIIRAFAEPVKRTCQQLYLLSDLQLYDTDAKERVDPRWNLTPRQMFQQVGTDYVRQQLDPDFWLKHFELWYQQHRLSNHVIIVPDVRFQNEVDLIHKLGGKVVFINRPAVHTLDSHESEVAALNLQHLDYSINNCSTIDKFHEKVLFFIEVLENNNCLFK